MLNAFITPFNNKKILSSIRRGLIISNNTRKKNITGTIIMISGGGRKLR